MPTLRQLCVMVPCSTWPHADLSGDLTKCTDDMQSYLTKVHQAISPDGMHLCLHGASSARIEWPAIRASWSVASLSWRTAAPLDKTVEQGRGGDSVSGAGLVDNTTAAHTNHVCHHRPVSSASGAGKQVSCDASHPSVPSPLPCPLQHMHNKCTPPHLRRKVGGGCAPHTDYAMPCWPTGCLT